MKKITFEALQNILRLYDKEKSISEWLFGNSKVIVVIENFVRSTQIVAKEKTPTNLKRELTNRELVDFFRLLVNIEVQEDTAAYKAVLRLLELFYPKTEKTRTKLRQYTTDRHLEGVFKSLDKFKFFNDDPNQFITLCDFFHENHQKNWFFFYFVFSDFGRIGALEGNSQEGLRPAYAKPYSDEEYYYQIVQALWMLKQLNMTTSSILTIIKQICKPKIEQNNCLSDLIDICVITHDNLLGQKFSYEEQLEEWNSKQHYSSYEFRERTTQRWVFKLFNSYKLLSKAIKTTSKNNESHLPIFVNSFIELSKYSFYSTPEREKVEEYCTTVKKLNDCNFLTPSLVLVILGHPDPLFLLKLILQLNRKPTSDNELNCLKNFRAQPNVGEDLIADFNSKLEKQNVVKTSRLLGHAFRDRSNRIASIPRDVLLEIAKSGASTLNEADKTKLATKYFNP
jgi:hypothetical protein